MKRFLILLSFTLFGQVYAQAPTRPAAPAVVNYGWVPPSPEERALAQDNVYTQQLRELVKYNDDSDALIYKFLYQALQEADQLSENEKQTGRLDSLNQREYGHCIGFGTARALSVTAACDIYIRKELESWKVQIQPTAAYALSREDSRGRYDGSTGASVASSVMKYGSLHYLVYGEFDLTKITGEEGRQWAANGVPKVLLEEAKKHKVLACAKVTTIPEAEAAISNGYGIIICAQASYSETRGPNGEAKLTGSKWAHCQSVIGRRQEKSGMKGFLVSNSWGNSWQSGPVWLDQPFGAYWVSDKDLEYALKQDDSYALAGYEGFKRRDLKWDEIFKIGEEINVEDN